jgi:hypothetical protein
MIVVPQPIPPAVTAGMVQNIVDALCDRPGDSDATRATRTRDVVHSVQAFRPRDPVEVMLAGMAVIHAYLIQDAAHDLSRGQDARFKARTKTSIVALDRGMLGFLKELRVARARVFEGEAPPGPVPEAAGVAPVAGAATKISVEEVKQQPASARPDAVLSPSRTEAPQPPVPQLPSLRRADTSVAAMFAVLSPPVLPHVVFRATIKPPPAPGLLSPSGVQMGDAGRRQWAPTGLASASAREEHGLNPL